MALCEESVCPPVKILNSGLSLDTPRPDYCHTCSQSRHHLSRTCLMKWKITPRAQRQLIQQVTKDPTTTSKELQASLASVKVSVHNSTIRNRLGKNGLHGKDENHHRAKRTWRLVSVLPENMLMIPKTFGKILCGLMRQKLNFLEGVCPIPSGIEVTQHFRKRTSYQQ